MATVWKFLLIGCLIGALQSETIPHFSKGTFYPKKEQTEATKSELKSSGPIRDVIKRNTPRWRKVLIRNSNSYIQFATEDSHYMTSRGKSKLDILASLVRSRMHQTLRVEKAWTDNVDLSDFLSLHYEGRAFAVKLASKNRALLSTLARLSVDSGFDWVYYKTDDFIHISVIPDVCQTKLNLAIVVDTSGSVGLANFNRVKLFLKNLVDFFNIGVDETHIALVSFSYVVRVEFRFNQYHTKDSLKAAIDRIWYQRSVTYTGNALISLVNEVFKTSKGMRDDAAIPKVGILLTDGYSNGPTNVANAAKRVKDLGVNMFAVGITNNPPLSQMKSIASEPFSQYYFDIDKFTDLSGFVDQISTVSCDESAQISTCDSAQTSVDGGSFKYFKVKLSQDVSSVTIELNDVTGLNYLYASLTLKNPGPLSTTDIQKEESQTSPRTIRVSLNTAIANTLYIAVQGQKERNDFKLNVWNSLFPKNEITVVVSEDSAPKNLYTAGTKDNPTSFVYKFNSGNERGDFQIDQNSGVVRNTRNLDREQIESYKLGIVAQHKQEKCLQGLMILIVNVNDVNDNGPKFEKPYSASVREDAPSNQYVIQVKATDKDLGTNAEVVYGISGPSAYKNVFKIDPNTGVIRTLLRLDYETKSTYDLQLTATDKGQPLTTPGTTILRITIVDVNEPPNFTGPPCILNSQGCDFTIPEEQQVSTAVGQTITATDPDTKQGCTLAYRIVSLDSRYFDIGRTSGVITIKSRLDREVKEYYSIDVEVSDCGRPKLSQRKTVRVRATDINDNAPVLASARVSVPENTQRNIFTFRATDRDAGSNSLITYKISNANGNNQFALDSQTGILRVIYNLDRETKNTMTLQITASDTGNPPKSTTVDMHITVSDLNDNSPEFTGSSQQSVHENVGRRTLVFKATATDRDAGLNAQIKYTIVAGNIGNMFYIDQSTADVRTNGIPDREYIASYTLTIKAQDFGSPQKYKQKDFTIKILDKNDNKPVFTNDRYNVKKKENFTPSNEIMRVEATDRDEGINSQMTFSLVSGHDDAFDISPTTGSITLIKAFDFGVKNYFVITVQAKDKGIPSQSSTSIVAVYVEDSNDFDPKFSKSTYTVDLNENVGLNHPVITVEATDQDRGTSGEIVYSIVTQNSENAFYINSGTGKIQTRVQIDYERTNKYELQIKASDKGSPKRTSSVKVTINIKDLNDNKPTFQQATVSISEDSVVGLNVISLVAQDRDSGSNAEVTFELETKNIPFSITAAGVIKTTAKLDRESINSYQLKIKVTDKGTNPSALNSDGFVNVKITDVNDNYPIFYYNKYSCSIKENSPSITHVCYVIATDKDLGENARIAYFMANPSTEFSIVEATGEIRSKISLDRETKQSFEIQIKAEDHGLIKLNSIVNVTITIGDLNDNTPLLVSAPYAYDFNEEQNDNTEVGSFIATDKDVGSNAEITYSIVSGHIFNGQAKFSLVKNQQTKQAVLKASKLDRETKNKYVLTIKAIDNGSPRLSSESKITVNIVDINDNSPNFKKPTYTGEVDESVGLNTYVLNVEATDADVGINSEIEYTFKSGINQDHFTLNSKTGEIHTAKSLDYETVAKYDFTVQAADKGSPASTPATAQVTINIGNVDDNAPEFSQVSTISLPENTALNHAFVRLKAADKDNNVLNYQIEGGNNEDKFHLRVEGTGTTKKVLMIIKNELDRETTDKYNITVSASDSSTKVFVHVPIEVSDINDNNPMFKNFVNKSSIPESNTLSSTELFTIEATDRDLGTNAEIEYLISSGNADNKFKIDSKSGIITPNKIFDRESVDQYDLVVMARDKGTPSLSNTVSVTVFVTDINDNNPVFEKSPYSVSIFENTKKFTKILDIRATDADIGDNGRVSYIITNGDQTAFSINTTTGELSTLGMLDREAVSSYRLTIKAYDSGSPMSFENVNISITILDVNDNNPIIGGSSAINNVNESASIELEIGNINAEDKDLGINAELLYKIKEENNKEFFRIDESNGKVFLQKKLDRETEDIHKVTVIVEDKGSPLLRVEKRFDINVLDNNDEKPEFGKISYSVDVQENKIEKNLIDINATDNDIDVNAVLTYTLSDNKNGVFAINAQTGLIFMNKAIDYEKNPLFELTVQAADWKFKTKVNVTVNVENINDNYPIFEQNEYTVDIPEDTNTKSPILTVNATDADDFGGLTYTISTNIIDLPFDINSDTGIITVIGNLNRETTDKYKFNVSVADKGNPKLETTVEVIIKITDVNDNKPIFATYNIKANLTENNNIGAEVVVVKASDNDLGQNAEIRYRAKPGTNVDDFEIGLTDGVIRTKKSFDRENRTTVTFIFQAYDLGSPELTSKDVLLEVRILDENDNAPIWTQKDVTINIAENTDIGTAIRVFSAEDADVDDNGRVSHYILNSTTSPLIIDIDSGMLAVSKLMDRETKDKYEITLQATDNGTPSRSSITKIIIVVSDVNDNAPEISAPYSGKVFENLKNGTTVITITATDLDLGPNAELVFKLLNHLGLFEIDSSSGILRTKTPLDREEQDQYVLTIEVIDQGEPALNAIKNFTININDDDDNCPVFQSPEYHATIHENIEHGAYIITVKATDKDIGTNAELDYGVLNGNDRGVLGIDAISGNITVIGDVAREVEGGKYWIKVRAGRKDCGKEATSDKNEGGGKSASNNFTFTTVYITVIDTNDNAPVFINGKEDVLYKTVETKHIIQLNATDADAGVGGQVNFRIEQTKQRRRNNDVVNELVVEAYDKGLDKSLVSNQTLIVVNKVRCDAMRFLINKTSGQVTVQSLCSVSNVNKGDLTLLIHQTLNLTCEAKTNQDGVKYSWLKDGVFLSNGQSNGNYVAKDITLEHSGSYRCLANNDAGVVESNPTTISVHEKPSIISEPKAISVGIGQPFTMEVTAKGVPDVKYQWYKNGFKYSGKTKSQIHLSEAITGDYGEYYCQVSNAAGSVNSKTVKARVFEQTKVVSLTVVVTNPDLKENCHHFFSEDFQSLVAEILSEKVLITKIVRGTEDGNSCNITACSKNPCLNDGECTPLKNGEYQCACKSAWTGKHCETDVDECHIPGFTPCYDPVSTCRNINGSFICDCPNHLTGRQCEFETASCNLTSCNEGYTCIPKTGGNHTCAKKSNEIILLIGSKQLLPWGNDKRYLLENWLNEIIKIQKATVTTTTGNKRKRRNAIAVNLNVDSCTIHIINATTENGKVKVTIALDCPKEIQKNATFVNSVCSIFLSSSSDATSFAQCGQPNAMKQQERDIKPATMHVNIVVENKDGTALNGDEALNLISQKDLSQKMNGKYTVDSPKLAYAKQKSPEGNSFQTIIIGSVCGFIVVLVIIAAVVIYFRRREDGYVKQSLVMQKRSENMTKDPIKLDLVGYSNSAYSTDEAADGGAFMFEVPSALKASN